MNNGAFGENFPYSNFHDLNLDWIVKIAKDFLDQYTNIQDTITQGLEDLNTKTEDLQALLDEWYTEHSQDIANQLADALEDLNQWYTTHQNYLDQTLADNIALFRASASEIATETIESIPDDYTDMYNTVQTIQTDFDNMTSDGIRVINLASQLVVLNAFLRCDGVIETGSVATNLKYYKIPCVEGQTYYVTGQTRNTLALYGFMNTDGEIIGRYPTTDGTNTPITYLDQQVTIPANAKYLIINDGSGWLTANPGVSIKADVLNARTVLTASAIDRQESAPTPTIIESKFLNNENQIRNDTNLNINQYPVTAGERYRIIGQTRYASALYGFIIMQNSTEIPVGAYPSTPGTGTVVNHDVIITIPVGVAYLLVNDGTVWGLETPVVTRVVKGGYIAPQYLPNKLYQKKINVIGDSMVKGQGVPVSKIWTTLLANNTGATVRNYGINGSYLSNHSVASDAPPVIERYQDMNDDADIVIVFAGTNDANNNIAIGEDDSTDTTTIKGAMNVLCNGLITKYPKSKIAFITPYLRLNSIAFRNTITAIITIAKKYSIPVFDNWTNGGVYRFNSAQASALMHDDTHLNEEGMRYVVNKYQTFIESL